jgi:hypothetical protein
LCVDSSCVTRRTMAADSAGSVFSPSVHYRSARNPVAAIRTAMLNQLETKGGNRRSQWKALCEGCKVDVCASLTVEQLCNGIKAWGSGIQLQPCDVAAVLASDTSVDFTTFTRFCDGI